MTMNNAHEPTRPPASRNHLVEAHRWLVDAELRFLHASARTARLRDDLFQEGCLALLQAAHHYPPTSETPFDLFARPQVRTAIRRAVRREARAAHHSLPHPNRVPAPTGTAFDRASVSDVSSCPARSAKRWHTRVDLAVERCYETIGDRFRAEYAQALDWATVRLAGCRARRSDRPALLRFLVEQRLLVPEPDHRMPLRSIARRTGWSVGRVAQLEQRLRDETRQILAADRVVERLRAEARCHPDGMNARVDAQLSAALAALSRRRFLTALFTTPPERRARLVARLIECSGPRGRAWVSCLYASLPGKQQQYFLQQTRARAG
jgi:RNA polymerase sigma factor (sigma-70 family)